MDFFAHETAVIDDGAEIGSGTKIWHFAHICDGAKIGNDCSFGQNTMVAPGVVVGSNVKVQNNVAIYTGTEIEDDVFLGPSCVLTNVTNPRSQVVRRGLYEKTVIRRGTSIGANATIVCGITLGRYSFIAAGAVVTKDVPDYGFVMGVPGKLAGHMSRHGHILNFNESGKAACPESGFEYEKTDGGAVRCLDLDEDASLPENLREGKRGYDEFKDS
ncbi:MAG: N-acetyltransferase [Verrucomicrobiales bacterium]|nr:N-acetyltransferase [Verrucomicrobiales bacterium]